MRLVAPAYACVARHVNAPNRDVALIDTRGAFIRRTTRARRRLGCSRDGEQAEPIRLHPPGAVSVGPE